MNTEITIILYNIKDFPHESYYSKSTGMESCVLSVFHCTFLSQSPCGCSHAACRETQRYFCYSHNGDFSKHTGLSLSPVSYFSALKLYFAVVLVADCLCLFVICSVYFDFPFFSGWLSKYTRRSLYQSLAQIASKYIRHSVSPPFFF